MEFKIIIISFFISFAQGLTEDYTVDVRSAYDQDLYESVLDAELCQQQLEYLQNSSLRLDFLDASAKVPSGMLAGNVNDLGSYFQCLDINEILNNMEFQGKYCAITMQSIDVGTLPEMPNITWPDIPWPPRPETPETVPESVLIAQQYNALRRYALGVSGYGEPVENRIFPMLTTISLGATYGICVPHVCTAKQALDYFIDQVPFVNVSYSEYFCRLPNDKPYSGADYTAMAIFGILACLLILSTSYDLYCSFVLKDSSSANKLYCCFSVYTNSRRFLTFNKVPGALECVDGIRAISMLWVVVGHTYSFTLIGYIHNVSETLGWLSKFSSTWINSAPITVDTFFMLSGILAVYTTVGKISRSRFVRTIHLFYINRLMRMFPLLATIVLLQASLFNHMSDGPFWLNVSQQAENCRKWWWSALLHVQNYVNAVEICIPQSWYLSVDVQLYFFCPIIMVWMFGREAFAWIALSAILLLSLVSSTVYSFLNNFSAALANPARLPEFNAYVTTYYVNTLTRAPPFFVGMVYGYLLHLCRNKRVRISMINVTILWALSFLMMAFCIFSIYPVMQIDHEGQIFDNLLNAYMRAIWACGLGWLIFACVHGYGGPINWFLSLQMWKLPARLSFAMYLVHVSIIMIANGSWVKTHYFSEGNNCIPQSWYLSVDVQLYFFCPIIMVWMFGREAFAWIALSAILLLSLVSSTVYSFLNNFSAALANPARLPEFNAYVTTYYVNTLTRAPPFFVGMVYGYLLHLCRNKRVRISMINVTILWALSFLMMAFCIFSIYPVMQIDHEGQIFDNLLNAYMRAIWACGLGWLIFACVHGYGGPINWFLSLQMWKLPARLSFAMYLVHVSIIMIANGSWVKTHYFSEGNNIYRFMSDITLTFIAAFILCIAIDAPFSTLQKLLMGGGKKPPQKPRSESRNNIIEDEPRIIKTSL